jgi:hypothetical protein
MVVLGLCYASDPELHKELKLSDEEAGQLSALGRKCRRETAALIARFPGDGAADRKRKLAKVVAETEKAVDELLSAPQLKRFRELVLQDILRVRERDCPYLLAKYAAIIEALSLNDFQREQFLHGEHEDRVLSKDQQKRLAELKGLPYSGSLRSVGPSFIDPLPKTPSPVHLIILGLPYVESPALHKELQLSEKLIAVFWGKLEFYRETLSDYRLTIAFEAEAKKKSEFLDRYMEKHLGDMLTAKQLKRFKEITLQELTNAPDSGGTLALHAEIVEALNLTAVQREKLYDGERLEWVLSKEQQTKWAALKGETFRHSLKIGEPGGSDVYSGFPRGFSDLPPGPSLLRYPAIHGELNLSEEQRRKVTELPAKWEEVTWELTRPRGYYGDAEKKKFAEAVKILDQEIAKILKPGQHRRLREIVLQLAHKQSMWALLETPGESEELGLTEEQKNKVKAIDEESGNLFQLCYLDRGLFVPGPDGDLRFTTGDKIFAARNEKLAALLTKEQNDRLKEMLRKPFTGELLPIGDGFPVGAGRPRDHRFAGFVPPT